jgi:hypothetical protein
MRISRSRRRREQASQLLGIAAAQLVEQIGDRAGLHDKELLKEHGDAPDRRQLDHAHNGCNGRGLGRGNAAGRALGFGYRFGILPNLHRYRFPIFGNLRGGLVIEPPALHHRASRIRLQRGASGAGCNPWANVINADRNTSRSVACTSSGSNDPIRSGSLFTATGMSVPFARDSGISQFIAGDPSALRYARRRNREGSTAMPARHGAAENHSATWG